MNKRRTLTIVLLAVVSFSAYFGIKAWANGFFDKETRELAIAKERGVRSALERIKAGKPELVSYGKPPADQQSTVDPETGLPVKYYLHCTVSPVAASAEAGAHNETVRAWHAKNVKQPGG
jgi:hypothetical protein